MRVILQRYSCAAQHYSLPLAIIHAHLNQQAATVVGQVVEVNAAFVFLTLGEVGALGQHSQ